MPSGLANVEVQPINVKTIEVPIVGTTPMVQHQFSEKSRKQILMVQMGQRKAMKREKKNPKADFEGSLHVLKEGKFKYPNGFDDVKFSGKIGFPAGGIKDAIVAAARNVDGLPMTLLRGALFILGSEFNQELVEVNHDKLIMREDIVRVSNGAPDIRYRGEMRNWTINLKIQYNADVLNADQIVNLINIAGFGVGLGEMRPGKSGGDYGRFKVKGT